MGRNTIKRKQLRRKFKRRAAALAGAAILTGSLLSGMPVTKVMAAEAPLYQPPTKTEQTVQIKKDARPSEKGRHKDARPPGRGWHQHNNSWPGSNENQAWYQDGKIYYRSDNNRDNLRTEYVYQSSSPVDYAKASASIYGFNASLDQFRLLTNSSQNALVEVRKYDTGKLYNILLERTYDNGWKIVDIRAL